MVQSIQITLNPQNPQVFDFSETNLTNSFYLQKIGTTTQTQIEAININQSEKLSEISSSQLLSEDETIQDLKINLPHPGQLRGKNMLNLVNFRYHSYS